MKRKCPGTGQRVMLAWPPDSARPDITEPTQDLLPLYEPYPGGLICPVCSIGMEVLHRTVRRATYTIGDVDYPCFTGIVRAHRDPNLPPDYLKPVGRKAIGGGFVAQ